MSRPLHRRGIRGFRSTATLNTALASTILSANPHREYVVLSNVGPLPCLVNFGAPPPSSGGMLLSPSQRPVTFDKDTIGDLVTLELFGIALVSNYIPAGFPASVFLNGGSCAAPGAILSVTAPADGLTVLASAFLSTFVGGAPLLQLTATVNGQVTAPVLSSQQIFAAINAQIDPGSKVEWDVATPVAGSFVDAGITLLQSTPPGVQRVSALTALVGESCYNSVRGEHMPRRGYQTAKTALKGAVQQLLPANPNRDYLVLSCGGPLPCTIGFGQQPSQTSGIFMNVNGGPLVLTLEDVGDIITLDINIFGYDDGSAGTATSVTALAGESCGMVY